MSAPDGLVEAVARGLMEADPVGTWDWEDYVFDAQAALAAHSEWMRAEGFVVVPVEPTEAMLEAGNERARFVLAGAGSTYRAMLTAAQS